MSYVAISIVWILFSDLALQALVKDLQTLSTLQTIKGWVFVLTTGWVLYAWIAQTLRSRERMEVAYRDAEGRYRGIFENLQEGVFQTSPSGKVIAANKVITQLLGYPTPEEFLTAMNDIGVQLYVHPEQRRDLLSVLNREGGVRGFETEVKHRSGSTLWISINAHVVRDHHGAPAYYVGTIQDITARKLAQLALAESRTHLDLALASSDAGTWYWDVKANSAVWDEQYHTLYGYPPGAAPSFKLWSMSIHEDDRQRILERIQSLTAPSNSELWNEEFRVVHPEKGIRWMQGLGRIERDQAGQAIRFRGINIDITERKQTQEALRRSEELLQLQIQRMPIGCIVWDVEFRVTSWNPAASRIFGFTAEEAMGKHPYDFIVAKELQPHVDMIWKRLLEGDETASSVNENTRKDGRVILGSWTNTPLRSPGGRIIGALSMIQDITEQRRAEEELRASEEKYRLIVETAEEGIWVIDEQERTIFANAKIAEMLGYTVEEMIGRSLFDFMDEEGRAIGTINVERRRAGIREQLDYLFRTKTGKKLWALLSTNPIRSASGAYGGALAMVSDITARKKSEQEVQEMAENLRAFAGRLQTIREEERTRISREIHDELGQSLTGLKMDLKWFERRLPSAEGELHEKIRSMSSLIDATIVTVRKISTELRPGVLELGLGPALEWGCREFESRSGIRCAFTRSGHEVLLQELQATSLFRIYQELLTNIIRHAEATAATVRLSYGDDAVTLEVADNGKGIPEHDLLDRGSLGLLGMRERAMLIGGSVSFESTPGQGTSVKVMVPVILATELTGA